jgi:hypothetical protein
LRLREKLLLRTAGEEEPSEDKEKRLVLPITRSLDWSDEYEVV